MALLFKEANMLLIGVRAVPGSVAVTPLVDLVPPLRTARGRIRTRAVRRLRESRSIVVVPGEVLAGGTLGRGVLVALPEMTVRPPRMAKFLKMTPHLLNPGGGTTSLGPLIRSRSSKVRVVKKGRTALQDAGTIVEGIALEHSGHVPHREKERKEEKISLAHPVVVADHHVVPGNSTRVKREAMKPVNKTLQVCLLRRALSRKTKA